MHGYMAVRFARSTRERSSVCLLDVSLSLSLSLSLHLDPHNQPD